MPCVDACLKHLKSPRGHVRDKAAIDLCLKVALQKCDNDLPRIVDELKVAFLNLGLEARIVALDVVFRGCGEENALELARNELGYAYLKFRSGHDYLVKILHAIYQGESKDVGLLGNYFDIEKQFNIAFELLSSTNSDVLN